jgi:hypothetical protein
MNQLLLPGHFRLGGECYGAQAKKGKKQFIH